MLRSTLAQNPKTESVAQGCRVEGRILLNQRPVLQPIDAGVIIVGQPFAIVVPVLVDGHVWGWNVLAIIDIRRLLMGSNERRDLGGFSRLGRLRA